MKKPATCRRVGEQGHNLGGDPLIQSPSLGLAVDIVCHTGIQTGLYASEMIPRGLTPFSGPTRSGFPEKCQISQFRAWPYSDFYSK